MKLPDLCENARKQSMTPCIWIGTLSPGLSSKGSITHLPTSVTVSPIRPESALTCPLCVQSRIHPVHWRRLETGENTVTEHHILECSTHGKELGISHSSPDIFGDRIWTIYFFEMRVMDHALGLSEGRLLQLAWNGRFCSDFALCGYVISCDGICWAPSLTNSLISSKRCATKQH